MLALIAAIHLSVGTLWNPIGPGIWFREERVASSGPLSIVRAIIVRIDPSLNRFRLDLAQSHQGLEAEWTVDSMPVDAVVALNAGQFTGGFPWGWLVRDGIETKPRGSGALAMSFIVDSTGRPSLVTPAETSHASVHPVTAFQSYPALLVDGEIPVQLSEQGRGVDLDHHDSRLAICTSCEGHVMIVLTRVASPGGVGQTLPWGPTVPEMARYMSSLGCMRAMLLDGGLSSQMAVRTMDGRLLRWSNWRRVPLAMIVTPVSAAVR